ncbi:MAG: response regulator [Chloroflexota bacterium]
MIAPPPAGADRAIRTVLVVEDDEPVNRLVRRILAGWGYGVRGADDGFAALAAIERERPDLVLADVMMPGLSGIDLVRRLGERQTRLPVVLFSAYDRHQALPPVPFLLKPFTLGQFRAAVEAALEEPLPPAPERP